MPNYLTRDFAGLRKRLTDMIPQLTDRWTDNNPSDVGMVLLELISAASDMLGYYIDANALEGFLSTSRQRQSVIDLCRMLGYRLDLPVAATADAVFSIPLPLSEPLIIPQGCVCRARLSDGNIDFETVDEATIPAGETSVSVGVRQGRRRTETFAARDVRWQQLRLASTAIAEGTIRVTVGTDAWTEVRHFVESNWESLHFKAEADALGYVTVSFGDGRLGAQPPTGVQIDVSYIETLGDGGNVGPGRITELVTPIYAGNIIQQVTVTNPTSATGGTGHETTEHARLHAPAELGSLWKGTTPQDYQALASGYPGIAKAKVLDCNDCTNIRYFQINIIVAPNGGGYCSQGLKDELAAYIESRKTAATEVRIFAPLYRDINVDADVYCYNTEDTGLVETRVREALEAMLEFDTVQFGQSVYPSDIIAAIDNTRGVSHVEVSLPSADVIVKPGELPRLGNVNLRVQRGG